jgi:anti-anti-sigma factor
VPSLTDTAKEAPVTSTFRIDPSDDVPPDQAPAYAAVERDGHVVVSLHGEIDLAVAGGIRDQLMSAANRSDGQVVVDATGVTFIDSSGINALVRGRDRATALGGSFHLVADQHVVLRVLELMQLERALNLVTTLDDALTCAARGDVPHTCRTR